MTQRVDTSRRETLGRVCAYCASALVVLVGIGASISLVTNNVFEKIFGRQITDWFGFILI